MLLTPSDGKGAWTESRMAGNAPAVMMMLLIHKAHWHTHRHERVPTIEKHVALDLASQEQGICLVKD